MLETEERVIAVGEPYKRHTTQVVRIGSKFIGGQHPVLVQSMTNTDTADYQATAKQIIALAEAGSEIVRITVNNDEAAKAVVKIKELVAKSGIDVPLVGCFHYNGHRLLSDHPELCEALDKYRINPGNVGFGEKRDRQFEIIIEKAIKYEKPVRIGVNWGSLDQDLLASLMDINAKTNAPKTSEHVLHQALVMSALESARKAEEIGLSKDKIVISCKVSRVQDLLQVYQEIAARSDYALHLGLTEAGMGAKGIVATASALALVLQNGIGDTIRASLTPKPGGDRTEEVSVCQEVLQSIGLRSFAPSVSACPGCGRTTSTYFQELADNIGVYIKENMKTWAKLYPGVEKLNIAVMGCIVNGPGESKHSDIGISLPGSGESPIAPVFIDGEKKYTLRGDNIAGEFKEILGDYVRQRFMLVRGPMPKSLLEFLD